MKLAPTIQAYAAKMRTKFLSGTDLVADARFVDMLVGRGARILDIGWGIGSAVAHLRTSGHVAYGIDASSDVLAVARELHDPTWFAQAEVGSLTGAALADRSLPSNYDAVLMSGNVPTFLSEDELIDVFVRVEQLLVGGGRLVIGTTTAARGGPDDLDRCAESTALRLFGRYCDWHLGDFRSDSPWSVSVYVAPGDRDLSGEPEGMFILPPARPRRSIE